MQGFLPALAEWFWFFWAVKNKTGKDLSSYRTDIPVLPLTVNRLEMYLGCRATSYLLKMQNATRVGR